MKEMQLVRIFIFKVVQMWECTCHKSNWRRECGSRCRIRIPVELNKVVADGGYSPKQISCFRGMGLLGGGWGGYVVWWRLFPVKRNKPQDLWNPASPLPPHGHTLFVNREFSSMGILRIKTASVLVLGTRRPGSAVKFSCISWHVTFHHR